MKRRGDEISEVLQRNVHEVSEEKGQYPRGSEGGGHGQIHPIPIPRHFSVLQGLHRLKRTMNNPFEAETESTPPPALSIVLEKAHLSRQKLEVERVIGRGQFGEVRRPAFLFLLR